MRRQEKLEKLADVLLMAASKAQDLDEAERMDGRSARTRALSKQIEGIALEFRAMAVELKGLDPKGEKQSE